MERFITQEKGQGLSKKGVYSGTSDYYVVICPKVYKGAMWNAGADSICGDLKVVRTKEQLQQNNKKNVID